MTGGIKPFKFIVEGILMSLFGTVGCVGNLLCIAVFSRSRLGQRSFHHLMLCLAVFDMLYIMMALMVFSLPVFYPWVRTYAWYAHLVPMLLPLAQIGLTGSIYLTLAIAIERYTTVCHPFFKLYHNWRSIHYILPICLFSVCYNIPKFMELTTETRVLYSPPVTNHSKKGDNLYLQDKNSTEFLGLMEDDVTQEIEITGPDADDLYDSPTETMNFSRKVTSYLVVVGTGLRRDPIYYQVYMIYMNLLLNGVIPLVTLVILNTLIYQRLRQFSLCVEPTARNKSVQLREVRLASVSCLIVGVFIVCHSVRWVPNIYELQNLGKELKWPPWIQFTTEFSHLLTVINSSVNFYIYFMKQHHRGNLLQDILPRCCKPRVVSVNEDMSNDNSQANNEETGFQSGCGTATTHFTPESTNIHTTTPSKKTSFIVVLEKAVNLKENE